MRLRAHLLRLLAGRAMLQDPRDGTALLDRAGRLLRSNARLAQLLGPTCLAEPWAGLPPRLHPGAGSPAPRGAVSLPDRAGQPPQVGQASLLPIGRHGYLLRLSCDPAEQALRTHIAQSQRLQAVGELAGGIAHDFNNLLTAIFGAAEDLSALSPQPEAADLLAQIRQSAERGAALVRHLLAFSRQQSLQPAILPLNEAVAGTAALLRRLLGGGVTLSLDLEEPGRSVKIDPTQLDQVLINLAVNAAHAMPGGGTLRIATGHHLALRPEPFGGDVLPAGRYVSLTVSDSGAGIPPDILPRIFEPFFTTRREAGGTGLGLSTVHGIVRQSDGYMNVRSAPGQGTCFTILLPRQEPARPPAPILAPLPRPAIAAPGGRVLLVEDEAAIRTLAVRALEKSGWRVDAVATGEEALALAEQMRGFACVISDVVLPGIDGPALVRRLRALQPGLAAILISGYADASLRQAMLSASIPLISKPFSMSKLTRMLGETLANAA